MESHLLQMRGLKQQSYSRSSCFHVASFTDAWIETKMCEVVSPNEASRIFYRCVD